MIEDQDARQIETQMILGPQLYRILMIDRPNIKDEEIEQAAKWLAKDLIKDNVDDVVVDAFSVIERMSRVSKLYMVIAQKQFLQDLYEMCFMAGANLISMTVAEFSFLQLAPVDNQASIIVYLLEEGYMRVLITCNGAIDFIRNIKIKTALDQGPELINEEIIAELNRSIDFYATQFGDVVKGIFYVPSEIFSESLIDLLKKQMTINIDVLYNNEFSQFLNDSRWNEYIMTFGLISDANVEDENDTKN